MDCQCGVSDENGATTAMGWVSKGMADSHGHFAC
jgi:hypothetical protein